MSQKITGIFCTLLLLLAPITVALAASCDCVYEEADAPSLSPIPCCGPMPQPCCYQGDDETVPAAEPIAEASTNPRLPAPVLLEVLKLFFPVHEFAQKAVPAPLSERPPGALCQELNFRQSWLI